VSVIAIRKARHGKLEQYRQTGPVADIRFTKEETEQLKVGNN